MWSSDRPPPAPVRRTCLAVAVPSAGVPESNLRSLNLSNAWRQTQSCPRRPTGPWGKERLFVQSHWDSGGCLSYCITGQELTKTSHQFTLHWCVRSDHLRFLLEHDALVAESSSSFSTGTRGLQRDCYWIFPAFPPISPLRGSWSKMTLLRSD